MDGGPEHDLDKRSLQERRPHAEREVAAAPAAIDWPARLRRLPGWRWDADSSVLRCPADEGLHAASGPDSQTGAQDPDITRQKTVPDRVGPPITPAVTG